MTLARGITSGLVLGVLVLAGTATPAFAGATVTKVASEPMQMAMTEASGNIVVLQEPPRAIGQADGFISVDTVIIGCTAGAAAGALAIALPVLTVASSGIGLPASASAILSTAGIGCAVGVVSGLAAIGTAWGLNLMNQVGDAAAN